MAQAGVQDVFFVFVQGADNAEHCFPNLSRSQVDNVRTLRRAVQKKARALGTLSTNQRISTLKLVFQNQSELTLVKSERLSVVTAIFHNTSGPAWKTLGTGVWPRLVAVVKQKEAKAPVEERGVSHSAGGRKADVAGENATEGKRRRREERSAVEDAGTGEVNHAGGNRKAGDVGKNAREKKGLDNRQGDGNEEARKSQRTEGDEEEGPPRKKKQRVESSKSGGVRLGLASENLKGTGQVGEPDAALRPPLKKPAHEKDGGLAGQCENGGGLNKARVGGSSEKGRKETGKGKEPTVRVTPQVAVEKRRLDSGKGGQSDPGKFQKTREGGGSGIGGLGETIARRGKRVRDLESVIRQLDFGEQAEGAPTGVPKAGGDGKKKVKTNFRTSEPSDDERPSLADGARNDERASEVRRRDGGLPCMHEKRIPKRVSETGRSGHLSGGGQSRFPARKRDGKGLETGRTREVFGCPESVEAEESCAQGAGADGSGSDDDVMCDECGEEENQDLLLRCATKKCATVMHVYCLEREMDEMPSGDWVCPDCEEAKEPESKVGNSRPERVDDAPARVRVDGESREGEGRPVDVKPTEVSVETGATGLGSLEGAEKATSTRKEFGRGEQLVGRGKQAQGSEGIIGKGHGSVKAEPAEKAVPMQSDLGGTEQAVDEEKRAQGPEVVPGKGLGNHSGAADEPATPVQRDEPGRDEPANGAEKQGPRTRARARLQDLGGRLEAVDQSAEEEEPEESGQQSTFMIEGPPTCQSPGCIRRAYFRNCHQGGRPHLCCDHKSPGMVKSGSNYCEVHLCPRRATHDFPGRKPPKRCAQHRENGMLPAYSICEADGCLTRASYRAGSGKPTRCFMHKSNGMMNMQKRCEHCGCSAVARYGFAGLLARFCKEHAEEKMVYR